MRRRAGRAASDAGRRVVVTGIGTVTAIGSHPGSFWANLTAGRVGARPWRLPYPLREPERPVYPVSEPELQEPGRRGHAAEPGRATRLAVRAGDLAWQHARLRGQQLDGAASGVSLGSGHGDTGVMEGRILGVRGDGVGGDDFQGITDTLAQRFGLWGPSFTVATACASGLHAVVDAAERIRDGDADLMLAGGTEALSPSLAIFFGRLFMRSPDLCRPFDLNRKGMVVGEGAAMVVLESESHARRRGACPLAWIAGGAVNCDAHDVTGMNVDRVASCLGESLDNAGLAPRDVDHVMAHGSGTKLNDVNEVQAIKSVYGDHAARLAISGIKSMIGHTSGASGSIGLAATVMGISTGMVPPTANLEVPDPDCDLDFVPRRGRRQAIRAAQVNAFGFGGSNTCAVVCAPGFTGSTESRAS